MGGFGIIRFMGLLNLLRSDPPLFLALAFLLLYSIIFHEMAHGWIANLFGDDTAKRYGRLTLNPVNHIDPLGLLMLFIVGFGWAKPVPVDYRRLQNSRFAVISVALAGVSTNILLAALAVFFLQLPGVYANPAAVKLLTIVARINIMLGAFNLIPIPPLDGSKVLMEFLPGGARAGFVRLERFGFLILIVLLYTGFLNPAIRFMEKLIYGLISMAVVFR